MGKHVPRGNLFPTVRTRWPSEVPTDVRIERVYLATTDRPIERPTVPTDASTVLLPE
jgi:hypothetical protein